MSRTAEYMLPKTMPLTPQHVDAMHLVKLFVKEYERTSKTNIYKEGLRLNTLNNFYETCKNFGF